MLDKSLLLRPAVPVCDSEIELFLAEIDLGGLRKWLDQEKSTLEFASVLKKWLSSFLQKNTLESFPFVNLTSGISGSFQDFYQIHHKKRLRILKGEYPFHRDVFESLGIEWKWLGIDDLQTNDFVILSYPFSGNGAETHDFKLVLDTCERLQIPVLVDCAFAGLSDLSLPEIEHYQCVQKISFSLSKFFNVGHLRCGIEFSRHSEGVNALLSKWDYGQKVSAFIGLNLIRQFPSDYILKKYRTKQLKVCEELQLIASPTVLFGLGDFHWNLFSRDNIYNRVCLSRIYE